MTISLIINDIPDYLEDSELYKNIESDDLFDIPEDFFRKELIINTFDDLISYIKIFDYDDEETNEYCKINYINNSKDDLTLNKKFIRFSNQQINLYN